MKKISFFCIFLSILIFVSAYYDFFNHMFEELVLAPLLATSLICLVITLYLLSFNQIIQTLVWNWFRWSLLFPALLFLILIYLALQGASGGLVSFNFGYELLTIILWGIIVGVATILHTFYHRFWLKTGVGE